MQAIAEPKVFISYAWGTEEYQDKVLQFCTRLQTECGVKVVIDKWTMVAGNDTIDFMERSVKDPDIHFVLMLIDKNYAEKADARKGGVGTETQIISPQVYGDTEQSKFVPIVFERGDNGAVLKPVYLNSRLHFDLTTENANDEFMRLVRHLYGEMTYPIPPKGKKPDWVSLPPIISPVISGPLFTVKNTTDEAVIKGEIKTALSGIIRSVFELSGEESQQFNTDPQKYLDYLGKFRPYRDAVISILESIKHKGYFEDSVADFIESYKAYQEDANNKSDYFQNAVAALLHETFLYIVALLWEAEEYSKIRGLLLHTYFVGGGHRYAEIVSFREAVYSGGETQAIDDAKKQVDNKNYHSGLAQLWTEHVMYGYTLEQLTFSDILVYNLDIVAGQTDWHWFPLLYVYGKNNRTFVLLSIKLKSTQQLKKYEGLFGDSSPVKIQEKLQGMKELLKSDRYRYSGSFDRAPLMLDNVKIEEIGTMN